MYTIWLHGGGGGWGRLVGWLGNRDGDTENGDVVWYEMVGWIWECDMAGWEVLHGGTKHISL